MEKSYTVGEYLLKRLSEVGLKHIFGVPGDFNLEFFDQIIESDIELVTTCNELNAGYAADCYARINNIGCVAITYAVGSLSAINAFAGSFIENLPVVMISGAPATTFRKKFSQLHHTLGDYDIPLKMFDMITVASVLLDNPDTAPDIIDKAIKACVQEKKPVYIELAKNVVQQNCKSPEPIDFTAKEVKKSYLLDELVSKSVQLLKNAKNPAIIAGFEVQRHNLQPLLQKIVEKSGFPFATMMLDKTVLSEDHPQYIGLYEGVASVDYVKDRIEKADQLLSLGTLLTDANLGWFTAKLNIDKMILACKGGLAVEGECYPDIDLKTFMEELLDKLTPGDPSQYNVIPASQSYFSCNIQDFNAQKDQKLTLKRFFDRMTCFIRENDIVISDVGTYMFSVAEIVMPKNTIFLEQSYYCSIGYSVGATLGACMAGNDRRVVTFVGDGAFQMTAQEISTILKQNKKPIIFLINNDGYTIERFIHDNIYNDIQPWKYHKLPEVFGDAFTCEARTEGELEDVLRKAENCDKLAFIEVHFDRYDCSQAMDKMLNSLK